jgi:MFS family permease
VAPTGEYFPKHRRSTSITFIYCGLSLGQFSSGEVTNLLGGWQGPLWVGGALSLLLAATLLALLPDLPGISRQSRGKPRIRSGYSPTDQSCHDHRSDTRLVAGARSKQAVHLPIAAAVESSAASARW